MNLFPFYQEGFIVLSKLEGLPRLIQKPFDFKIFIDFQIVKGYAHLMCRLEFELMTEVA